MLTETIKEADKRKSTFRFSLLVQQQWEAPGDDDEIYTIPSGTTKQHRVAVLYPLQYGCDDDYGCDWNWLPCMSHLPTFTNLICNLQTGETSDPSSTCLPTEDGTVLVKQLEPGPPRCYVKRRQGCLSSIRTYLQPDICTPLTRDN
jgi:hypothetical protein